MNLNGKMRKLQRAVISKGVIAKINNRQFYSETKKCVITCYQLCILIDFYDEKAGEWKKKDYEILKTCSVPDIIFCLFDIYKAVNKWN